MKQNLSRARADGRILRVVAVAFAIMALSCARQPRRLASMNEHSIVSTVMAEAPMSFRLNINTASATQLEKLPGVGKIMAERVVEYRQQYGPFRRAEHLMMVHGFSDHKFRMLRELITVE
jgi:competence protein ComEA